jgi:hypothetical protein
MANADKVLLDSLVAQRSDGSLVVGRGVPTAWLRRGDVITVDNFPTTDGHRLGLRITTDATSVTLSITAGRPSGPVLFQLPAFLSGIASASTGQVERASGTVRVGAGVRSVTVVLAHRPV